MKTNKMINTENIKFVFFCIFNFVYVFYMLGYIERKIYYISLIVFLVSCVFALYCKCGWNIRIKDKQNIMLFFVFYMFIIIYSLLVQIKNGDIQSYLFKSSIYILLPMVVGYLWYLSTEYEDMPKYFYLFFFRLVFHFILEFGSSISIDTIKYISWNDSNSSVFESSNAHDFMFLTLILLFYKKRFFALISAFFCVLSFKRLSFLLSILIILTYRFFPDKKCNKVFCNLMIGVISLVPFFYGWMINEKGQNFFLTYFNIDIDAFFTGRIFSINKWLSNIEQINGYGSISYYINIGNSNANKYSLHCDLYQLMLECTIVAVFLFLLFVIRFSRHSYYSLFFAGYIILELIVSQFFIKFSTWLIFYMFSFMLKERNIVSDKLLGEKLE